MFKRIYSAALIFGLAATAPPAVSQSRAFCAPRTEIVQKLTQNFGETPAGSGLQSASQVVEIWASDGTGTWTIFITLANGISCVVASGSDWQALPPAPPGTLG
ncbi:MAG: hypothetical protein KDA50_01080 [Rhodobacteraceae bacterium]|nr:hypothetical protein [Paracoccaceae bacterium]